MKIHLYPATLGIFLALFLLVSPGVSKAQVIIDATTTPLGFEFRYDYTVTNNSPETLALTTITTGSGIGAVHDLVAPTGFLIDYDSGLGLVSFLEDNDPFTPQAFDPGSVISGFSFKSNLAPGNSAFEALSIFGTSNPGITLAPIGPAAVPEPGAFAFGLALTIGLAFGARRYRQTGHRVPGARRQ